jgi:hypothetical protein
MTLSKRLARLEGERGNGAPKGPSVIFICSGEDGEPGLAFFVGGGSISREADETREAFEARAMASAHAQTGQGNKF